MGDVAIGVVRDHGDAARSGRASGGAGATRGRPAGPSRRRPGALELRAGRGRQPRPASRPRRAALGRGRTAARARLAGAVAVPRSPPAAATRWWGSPRRGRSTSPRPSSSRARPGPSSGMPRAEDLSRARRSTPDAAHVRGRPLARGAAGPPRRARRRLAEPAASRGPPWPGRARRRLGGRPSPPPRPAGGAASRGAGRGAASAAAGSRLDRRVVDLRVSPARQRRLPDGGGASARWMAASGSGSSRGGRRRTSPRAGRWSRPAVRPPRVGAAASAVRRGAPRASASRAASSAASAGRYTVPRALARAGRDRRRPRRAGAEDHRAAPRRAAPASPGARASGASSATSGRTIAGGERVRVPAGDVEAAATGGAAIAWWRGAGMSAGAARGAGAGRRGPRARTVRAVASSPPHPATRPFRAVPATSVRAWGASGSSRHPPRRRSTRRAGGRARLRRPRNATGRSGTIRRPVDTIRDG